MHYSSGYTRIAYKLSESLELVVVFAISSYICIKVASVVRDSQTEAIADSSLLAQYTSILLLLQYISKEDKYYCTEHYILAIYINNLASIERSKEDAYSLNYASDIATIRSKYKGVDVSSPVALLYSQTCQNTVDPY